MATGVRIRNSSGSIQIDDQYFNYAIIARGDITLVPPPSGNAYLAASATVRISAQSPMIAIQAPNGTALVGAVTSAGAGLWDVTILGSTQTLTYFVLDQCPQAGSHGVGLRIRRADGQIAFDSGFFYPKVVFYGAATKNDMPAGFYAVICAQAGGFMNPGAVPPNNIEYVTAYQTTTTGVIVQNSQPLRTWGSGISMNPINARYLMLDVSNVFI